MNIKRIIAATAVAAVASVGFASTASASDTVVPGQQGRDGVVTGHYTQSDEHCDYIVNYRGDFGTDPHLDAGWITNQIKCEDGSRINYVIVNAADPRYTGNTERAIWGSWEVVVETISGTGNIAATKSPMYAPDILGDA